MSEGRCADRSKGRDGMVVKGNKTGVTRRPCVTKEKETGHCTSEERGVTMRTVGTKQFKMRENFW